MIEILEPLSMIPGVRYAGLVSPDGVPILMPGRQGSAAKLDLDIDSLTALASQWFSELSRQAGELTWDQPVRAILRAVRGSLVLRQVKGGVLLALLDDQTSPEDLRLPMDGAAARLARDLRSMGGHLDPMADIPAPRSLRPSSKQSTKDQAKPA